MVPTALPDDSSGDPFRGALRLCVGVLFLLGLFAPALHRLQGGRSARFVQAENRNAYALPPAPHTLKELEAWPGRFTDYYGDSFGLRDRLIRWHNRLKWSVLGESPTDRLLLGEQGWVFYTKHGAIETYRVPRPFAATDLVAWQLVLEARRDWLAERGIEYLFVIVPNKAELYPERLPRAFERVGASRREQFLEHMAAHSDVRVLDLLPNLRREVALDSGADTTYNKYGTHWTDRGALAGYRAIVGELARSRPGLEPWPLTDFEPREGADEYNDSWSQRLYLSDVLEESFIVYEARRPRPAQPDASVRMPARASYHSQPDADLPRAMFVHDSFGRQLVPLLAQHFASLWAYWDDDFQPDVIERNAPDVLIQLYVDRTFDFYSPALTEEVGGELLRQAFAASSRSLLVLEPDDMLGGLRPYGEPSLRLVSGDPGGLEIVTHGGGDLVHLPSVDFPESSASVLQLDLESPSETTMAVLYLTRSERNYDRERSYSVRVPAGRSTLHVHLAAAGLDGSLLVRPGLVPGRYVLHRAEIRACAFR